MTDMLNNIYKELNKAGSVALYCHTSPDGDTIASSLAIFSALKALGKDVAIFCDSAIPSKYMFLKNADLISFPDKITRDVALAVDCSDIDRLGNSMRSFLSAKKQLAIDHHKSHKKFADLSFVDANASATGEIAYKLLKLMRLMNAETAELLFAAIVSDCGCFSFSNTTRDTHLIACELLSYDFNSAETVYKINKSVTKNIFDLKNRVLSKCRFFEDNSVAVLTFLLSDFEATNTSSSDTEGIISNVIDIDSVKVAYAVSEVTDKNFKISIRTKDGVDASDCASVFGGGGHKNAAGCRVNGYYEDVVDKLVKIARDRI